MRKSFLILLILFIHVITSCAQSLKYSRVLNNLNSFKEQSVQNGFGIESCSKRLFITLKDSIFPAWYGTEWDFNGISNTPGQGEIACGYFISTTLKHVGFNLNRYKLAQQAASNIIKSICSPSTLFDCSNMEDLRIYLSAQQDGLYVIGLSCHVGFILIEDSHPYFIHSDYTQGFVVKEEIDESTALYSSDYYLIGNLTGNKQLIKKWIAGDRIQIHQ